MWLFWMNDLHVHLYILHHVTKCMMHKSMFSRYDTVMFYVMLWIHPRRTLLVNYWKKLQYLIKQTLDLNWKSNFEQFTSSLKQSFFDEQLSCNFCPYYCLFPKAYKSYKRTQYRPHYPIVDYAIPGRVGPAFQNSRVVLSNTHHS